MPEIHLEARAGPSSASASRNAVPAKRPVPRSFAYDKNMPFTYASSPDGVDTNLLILLHGRGDSEAPFARLAKSLNLPQTATLALRGPQIVPLLDEHEREWWNETDMLGMDVPSNPSPAIKLLCSIVDELVAPPYSWHTQDIHLFGFGQGGTLCCEAGQEFHRKKKGKERLQDQTFGSIVSVHGPLLSLPTSSTSKTPTPTLYVCRQKSASQSQSAISALQRAYTRVEVAELSGRREHTAMPKDKKEWEPIMEFWSEVLMRRNAWELNGEASDIYEITQGQSQVKVPTPDQAAVTTSSLQGKENDLQTKKPVTSNIKKVTGTGGSAGLKRGFLSKGL